MTVKVNLREETILGGAGNSLGGAGGGFGGGIVQRNTVEASAMRSSAIMNYTTSRPDISQGVEIFSASITPTDPNNLIMVEVYIGALWKETTGIVMGALFNTDVDASAAIAAGIVTYRSTGSGGAYSGGQKFHYEMTAGTTASTTFSFRMGGGGANQTWSLQSNTDFLTYLGDYNSTRMYITEVQVGTSIMASGLGTIIQEVEKVDGSTIDSNVGGINTDDTPPLYSEMTPFMSVLIVPTDANSKLEIEWNLQCATTSTNAAFTGLFINASAGSSALTTAAAAVAGTPTAVYGKHVMTAGTTASTLFVVGFGIPVGTLYTNAGTTGAARYGDTLNSWIRVREYKVIQEPQQVELTDISGSNIYDLTIPSWATKIEIGTYDLTHASSGANNDIGFQLGTTAGILASTYEGGVFSVSGGTGANPTTYFGISFNQGNAAAGGPTGFIRLKLVNASTHTWIYDSNITQFNGAFPHIGAGAVSLGSALTTIRFMHETSALLFTSGQVSATYYSG